MKKFFKVFFYCIGFAALNLIMQFVAAIPVTIIAMIFAMAQSFASGNPDFSAMDFNKLISDSLLPSLILASLLTFGAAWLIHVIFKKPFYERLSLNKTPFLFIVAGFIAGCALQLPTSLILGIVEDTGIASEMFEQYSDLLEPLMTGQNLILQILAIGIIAPILEEILFRGLVLDQLRKHIALPLALIIQALLFGLIHLNIVQGSYAFVAGIILGLAMIWSRSLVIPVVMHIGMNLSGVFLSEYGAGLSNSVYLALAIVSFIMIPSCMVFFFIQSRKEKKALAHQEDVQIAS